MSLIDYGWDSHFEQAFERLDDATVEPARVTYASGKHYRVIAASGEFPAGRAGRLRHNSPDGSAAPVVGDWVAARPADDERFRIEQLLPRRTQVSRKVAGDASREQVVAANVDLVLVVMGLDGDYNLRRLERFLTMARESGARPAVLLNKSDVCEDLAGRTAAVCAVAGDAEVVAASCKSGHGLDAVRALLAPRVTAVLLGSSGVGKSTLINNLLGDERQKTLDVREGDDRGRHTTTHRELFRLHDGGLLIDNPGVREVQLWGAGEGLDATFEDIRELAEGCRFRDCAHTGEAGCAVGAAVADGRLAEKRLSNYHALQRELEYLSRRQDESAQRLEKRRWRGIHKEMRRHYKKKGR